MRARNDDTTHEEPVNARCCPSVITRKNPGSRGFHTPYSIFRRVFPVELQEH